jgi:hypothetical protein
VEERSKDEEAASLLELSSYYVAKYKSYYLPSFHQSNHQALSLTGIDSVSLRSVLI